MVKSTSGRVAVSTMFLQCFGNLPKDHREGPTLRLFCIPVAGERNHIKNTRSETKMIPENDRQVKKGDEFIAHHKNKSARVVVTEASNGRIEKVQVFRPASARGTYRSLSAAARAITNWTAANGWDFFKRSTNSLEEKPIVRKRRKTSA